MMCTWATSGHCAHKMFTLPAFSVVFQSKDEARAVHCVECVKELWRNSIEPLRERWQLSRPIDSQPYNYLELKNGSWCIGIPGDPDKIRSAHPTIVALDEAAFIDSDENYNVAVATRCKQIIALSSARPGWFREFTEFAQPVDWPDYSKREPLFPRL